MLHIHLTGSPALQLVPVSLNPQQLPVTAQTSNIDLCPSPGASRVRALEEVFV